MTYASGFPRAFESAIVRGGPIGSIPVEGIAHGDTLLSVVQLTAALARTDRFANASIPVGSNGRIAMATVDTSGSWLLVAWAKPQ